MKLQLWFFIIPLFIIIGSTCTKYDDPDLVNPFDTTGTEFVAPAITFTTDFTDGAVIDTHSVTLSWQGNETAYEYSWVLDYNMWSDWSEDTTVSFELLDDGNYTFMVKSRTKTGFEAETFQWISFQIDDVQGPAMVFYPRNMHYNIPGDTLYMFVKFVEVERLAGVSIVIPMSTNNYTITDYDIYDGNNSFFGANAEEVLVIVNENNAENLLEISMGRVSNTSFIVSGSYAIAQITIIINEDNSDSQFMLHFDKSCIFMNELGEEIQIIEFVDCQISQRSGM